MSVNELNQNRPEPAPSVNIENSDNAYNFSGNRIVGDGNTIGNVYNYQSSHEVLTERQLIRLASEDENLVSPSNLDSLLNILKVEHLIILEAPPNWGHEYVAEPLAARALEVLQSDIEEYEVLSHIGEITGRTVLDALKSQKFDDEVIENDVLYLSDASADSYSLAIIEELKAYAQRHSLYVIITTRQSPQDWKDISRRNEFVSMTKQAPFSLDDYAKWAAKLISKNVQAMLALKTMGIIAEDTSQLEATSPLKNLGQIKTLTDFIEKTVNAPSTLPRLPIYIAEVKQAEELVERITSAIENQDERLKDWFNTLQEDERYMVLTVSMVYNLPQQTFWAIYERLIDERWRKRNLSLRMTDYLEIQSHLSEFIEVQNDEIRFKDEDTRKALIEYVLSSYRRSLVNALPEIARLLTESDRSPVSSQESLNNNISALEIWGSDLAPAQESRERRDRLRNSLIASIVDIDRYESGTTDYILQAWAEQTMYPVDDRNREIAVLLPIFRSTKTAFSDVLLRMYQRDEAQGRNFWQSRRSLRLIEHWYQTIRQEVQGRFAAFGDAASGTRDIRRKQIRRTLAFTLCNFAANLSEEEFGLLDTNHTLLKTVPEKQVDSENLGSLWQMMLAFAWEKDYLVRLTLADWMWNFYSQHPAHFRALFFVLAGDWRSEVRFQMAALIWLNYRVVDPEEVQLAHYLLDSKGSEFVNRKLTQTHYLYSETVETRNFDFPPHLWTATMAMFLIGTHDENLFKTYLQSYLKNENSDAFKAFVSVATNLIDWESRQKSGDIELLAYYWRQWLDEPLHNIGNSFRLVLTDLASDRLLSPAARRFAALLSAKNLKPETYLSAAEYKTFRASSDENSLRNMLEYQNGGLAHEEA